MNQKLVQKIKDELKTTLTKTEGIGNYHFKWYTYHVKALGGFESFVDWMVKVVDACKLEGAGTILDLGAGYGEHSYVLSRLGNNVIAQEPRRIYLSIMKKLCEREKSRVRFVVGDSMKIDVKTGSVDVVYLNETISHMRDFPGSMREIVRVLKPEGRIIVMDTERRTWQSWQTMNVVCPKTDKTFYVPVRRRTIKNSFDKHGVSYTDAELDYLAEKTKGWTNTDLRKCFVDEESKTSRERHRSFRPPYSCVDPRSGQFMENLYTRGEVFKVLKSYGFVCEEIELQPAPRIFPYPDSFVYWWKCPGKFVIVGKKVKG